jgi:hypothetical protein
MTHRTGLASDLRVRHLVLVGDRIVGTCHMKGPSVVHLVPHVIHLRNATLVLVLLAGRLLRPRPPFAPLVSGQNLHHDHATILDLRSGHLLVLVHILQSLLYDRPFSEVIL